MNYKSDEMEGVVAPTDSRFREDLRSFEEGRIDESELNKNLIEEEQRRKRREMEQRNETWTPNFFKEVPHPFLKDNSELKTGEEIPHYYELIKGQKNGYWERRERGDWNGLPQLWGPFDN